MANLTRIKNNQITDKTIDANAKIVDQTITGRLFNPNITVTSDFLITGNLTVLGASTTTTVASTNTFVNDPLILLNNGQSSLNIWDLGLILNRGSGLNTALVWNEANSQFRFLNTSDTGTTYGNINQTSYANVGVGNLQVNYGIYNAGNLTTQGTDITSNSSAINFIKNTGAIVMGATTGFTNIQTPTLDGVSSVQTLWPTASNVVAYTGATSINIGNNSGTVTIFNPTHIINPSGASVITNIAVGGTTLSLANNAPATVVAFGSASAVTFGNPTGYVSALGMVWANAAIAATTQGSGALVVPNGGAGISGNLIVGQNAVIGGNLTVQGQTTYVNSITTTYVDNILELNTLGNGAVLTSATTKDVGLRFHYYSPIASADRSMGIVRAVGTGYLEVFYEASESGGNISGTYATIKTGNILLTSNVTAQGLVSVIENGIGIPNHGNHSNLLAYFAANIASTENVIVQNWSATGASQFAAYTDTGTDAAGGFLGLGVLNSSFDNTGFTAANAGDGFLHANIGNLMIAGSTTSKAVKIAAGGKLAANVALTIYSGTSLATSATTGAVLVTGGAAFSSNIFTANGATINYNQTSDTFTVRGAPTASTNLFQVIPNYQAVLITGPGFGGTAFANTGATFQVNSTDSMIVPVGTSSQRPGLTGNANVTGMMRFNSTINNLEFFDGTNWQGSGSTFTTISDRQWNSASGDPTGNVDGVNKSFTLQASSTTAATLISINGVLQLPTNAYSVSGSTLTFTEAPSVGDLIDARILVTTQTVTTISSADGFNQILIDANAINFYSGGGGYLSTNRLTIDNSGNINILTGSRTTYNQTNVNIPTTATVTVDRFAQTTYSTAKYVVQVRQGTQGNIQSMEALVSTDGIGNAWITTYAVVIGNGGQLGTLSANVLSGNVNLYFTATNSAVQNSNVKVYTTYIV